MKKNKVFLSEAEWRCVVRALNDFRNKLIGEGRDGEADFISEIILKVINAPIKKVKVKAA